MPEPTPIPELRYRIVCYELEDDQQTVILDATTQAFIAVTGTIDENNTMRGKGTKRSTAGRPCPTVIAACVRRSAYRSPRTRPADHRSSR
jgi:hypothetical protein